MTKNIAELLTDDSELETGLLAGNPGKFKGLDAKYWCECCGGIETVKSTYCQYDFKSNSFCVIDTGNKIKCPGCDGTGISVRAQDERNKSNSLVKTKCHK